MSEVKTDLITAVLAEDFRFDNSGKGIWIGTYGHTVNCRIFPMNTNYWFVCLHNVTVPGTSDVIGRIMLDRSEEFAQFTGRLEIDEPEDGMVMPFGPFPIVLQKPALLTIDVKIGSDPDWREVGTWNFRAAPSAGEG